MFNHKSKERKRIMNLWRLLINVVLVLLAVAGVVWQEASIDTSSAMGAAGIAIVASFGAALMGEFFGIIFGLGDFDKKTYFLSVAIGAVMAVILSLIVI